MPECRNGEPFRLHQASHFENLPLITTPCIDSVILLQHGLVLTSRAAAATQSARQVRQLCYASLNISLVNLHRGNVKHFIAPRLRSILTHDTSLMILVRGCAVAILFMQSLLLAQLYGAAELGQWILAAGYFGIIGLLVRLGLDEVMVRHVSSELAVGRRDTAGQIASGTFLISVSAAMLAALLSLLLAEKIASVLGQPQIATLIAALSPSLIGVALIGQGVSWLRAHKINVAPSAMSELIPSVSVTALIAAQGLVTQDQRLPLSSLGWCSSAAYLTAAVLIIMFCCRRTAIRPTLTRPPLFRVIGRTAPSFYLIAVTCGLIAWVDQWLLARHATAEDVAIYAVSVKLVQTTAIFFGVVNYLSAARYAYEFAQKDMRSLQANFRHATHQIVALTVPLLFALAIAGDWLLAWWGPKFQNAYPILLVLIAGQSINVVTGNCGYALMMTGHQHIALFAHVVTLILLFILCLALIPKFGPLGAAVAACISQVTENVFKAMFAWRRLGLLPFPLSFFK